MATAAERDAEVVRRGLRAGLWVWGVVAAVLVVVALLAGAGGRAGATGVMLGFALGSITCAGWLLLAGILDMLADHHPGRRRMLWTAVVVLVALVAPMGVLGAAGIPPS